MLTTLAERYYLTKDEIRILRRFGLSDPLDEPIPDYIFTLLALKCDEAPNEDLRYTYSRLLDKLTFEGTQQHWADRTAVCGGPSFRDADADAGSDDDFEMMMIAAEAGSHISLTLIALREAQNALGEAQSALGQLDRQLKRLDLAVPVA